MIFLFVVLYLHWTEISTRLLVTSMGLLIKFKV